jgi:hypothetical protein
MGETTTELKDFWRDLDTIIARARAMRVDERGQSSACHVMTDFLHDHCGLWPQVKTDATDNSDHFAVLTEAFLIRNCEWVVASTLPERNALRGWPIRLDECQTDAEREAWRRGYELACAWKIPAWNRLDETDAAALKTELLRQTPKQLHEVCALWWIVERRTVSRDAVHARAINAGANRALGCGPQGGRACH